MSELPSGWVRAPLKSLLSSEGIFSDGDWIESKDQDPNGSIRLLQLADIGDGYFVDKSSRFVNEEKFAALNCTELKTGDVLIARMPDPLGRACLLPEMPQPCITVVDVAVFRTGREGASNKWLKNAINSPQLRAFMETNSSGTTRKRIARGKLADMELHVPPLAEQKRIADKLDAVLARVDACRDRLDRIPAILKRFRKSVLAAATSGKLTEEWRISNSKNPENVPNSSIGSVAEIFSGYGFPKEHQGKIQGDYPFAKVSDISRATSEHSGILSLAANYVDEIDLKRLKVKPVPAGSTVFAKIGEALRLNRRAIARVPVILDNNCMALVPDESRIKPRYLFRFMQTVDLSPYSVATAVPSVRRGDVAALALYLPSLDEQSEIIRRVDLLFEFADRLEARHTAARAQVEKLTPSTLAKAFRGELVPQDPNDEPASLLLERIRAARAADEKTGKPQRRKAPVKIDRKSQTEVNMLELCKVNSDHLTTILNEKGKLAPKVLWQASQLGIEDFYEQLRTEEAKRLLREVREGNDSFLEAA